ncbi:hypothetical protein [Weissella paramesenteroides]|uniref:Uncharacterized protein n=1 Tax=Weissella paramesenteroides ATCC 33313 TaxID=585506 RepID=C5R894_WEIPA|nr:hypothetical protein [Weissella paramesenteroides]EER75678.1 hypothetical protein HMPREF0877_0189 [Weissella paramesenteroides ATCC 33313]
MNAEEEQKWKNRKKVAKSKGKKFIREYATEEELDWAAELINKKWNGEEIK